MAFVSFRLSSVVVFIHLLASVVNCFASILDCVSVTCQEIAALTRSEYRDRVVEFCTLHSLFVQLFESVLFVWLVRQVLFS